MTPRPSAPSSASQSSGTTAPKKVYVVFKKMSVDCGQYNVVIFSASSGKQHERYNRRSVDEEDEERRQKRKR